MPSTFPVSTDHPVTVVADQDDTIVSASGEVSDSEDKGVERRRLSLGEALELHGDGVVVVSHGPAPEKAKPKKKVKK